MLRGVLGMLGWQLRNRENNGSLGRLKKPCALICSCTSLGPSLNILNKSPPNTMQKAHVHVTFHRPTPTSRPSSLRESQPM